MMRMCRGCRLIPVNLAEKHQCVPQPNSQCTGVCTAVLECFAVRGCRQRVAVRGCRQRAAADAVSALPRMPSARSRVRMPSARCECVVDLSQWLEGESASSVETAFEKFVHLGGEAEIMEVYVQGRPSMPT